VLILLYFRYLIYYKNYTRLISRIRRTVLLPKSNQRRGGTSLSIENEMWLKSLEIKQSLKILMMRRKNAKMISKKSTWIQ